MNREIKFKAWNIKEKVMIDLYKATPLALDANLNMDGIFIPFSERFIVMQYIGLKDKNGVEIYEGDFITDGTKLNNKTYFWTVVYCIDRFCTIDYKNRKRPFSITKSFWERSEIIGNIYENPGLLT